MLLGVEAKMIRLGCGQEVVYGRHFQWFLFEWKGVCCFRVLSMMNHMSCVNILESTMMFDNTPDETP